MRQFFDMNNLEKFFKGEDGSKILSDFKQVFKEINLNPAFDSLLEVIQKSSFGPLLSMAGGIQALESLREPFNDKMHLVVQKIAVSETFQQAMREKQNEFTASQDLHQKIDGIVILSGILNSQKDEIFKLLNASNFQVNDVSSKKDWVCITAQKIL